MTVIPFGSSTLGQQNEKRRAELLEARDRLVDIISELPPDHPRRPKLADVLIGVEAVLEKTETDPVAILARMMDTMPAEDRDNIIGAPDWETRWSYVVAAVNCMIQAANDQSKDDAQAFVTRFGRALAVWVIDNLGRPEITDPYQALVYMMSGSDDDKHASAEWQMRNREAMRPIFEILNEATRH